METFKRFIRHRGTWLGLGIWILAGLVALGDHFELNKSEWASWVQAVGGIIAVIAAFVVANEQHRTSEKKQRSDEARTISTVRALFVSLKSFCVEIRTAFDAGEMEKLGDYPWNKVLERTTVIVQIPVLTIPSADVATSTIGLLDFSNTLINALRSLYSQDGERGPFEYEAGPEVEKALNAILEKVDHGIAMCDRELRILAN